MAGKACSPVVLSVLRQPARLCEIRCSGKVGQCSQLDWVPSLARLMNKIFCTFFYNCAPSWTADILMCFKIYYDRKISPWPKCRPLSSICKKSPFFVAFLLYVQYILEEGGKIHWPCTFSAPEAQRKQRDLCSVLCPRPVLCPVVAG